MRSILLLTATTALFLTGCAADHAKTVASRSTQWQFPLALPSWAADELAAESAAAAGAQPTLELPPGPSARVRGGLVTGPEAGPICEMLGLQDDAEMVLDEGCTREVVALTNRQSWSCGWPPDNSPLPWIHVPADRTAMLLCGVDGQATRFVVMPSAIADNAADIHFELARLQMAGTAQPELWRVESHPRLQSGQTLVRRVDPPQAECPRLVFVQLIDTP